MNSHVVYNISKFVNLYEYIQLSLIKSDIRKILYLKQNIPYHIKLEFIMNELVRNKFPKKLLEIFNPIKLYKVPIIKNKIYPGTTSYIDYINPSYFKIYPIIRGVDKINRLYISFYYNNKVTTIFQRYSDDNIRWVTGGCNPIDTSVHVFDFDNAYYEESPTIKILSELLNNDFCIYENIKYELNKI